MPEFHLNTAGAVVAPINHHGNTGPLQWGDLDAFTQGYIEALFFTDTDGGAHTREEHDKDSEYGLPNDVGFADLAPEALASIIADCAAFVSTFDRIEDAAVTANPHALNEWPDDAQAGRDFWHTRNGHGCGFWDGDWPEPYASELTAAAKAFGEVDAYLGDDGKVYV